MSQQIAFGVGCFHFSYNKQIPYHFSAAEYAKEVRIALEALPSVSDIEIYFDDSEDDTILITEEAHGLENGDFFPGLPFFEATFSVFIPVRVQAELFPDAPPRTETEVFDVVVSNHFHGPVAFVECVSAGEECQPSDAVRLLSKYLEREFGKLQSMTVKFECLGPSPFHANFYATAIGEDHDSLSLKEVKKHGYNNFFFGYNSILAPAEATKFIYDELSRELDVFYSIQCASVRLMKDGYTLVSSWHRLRAITAAPKSIWNLRSRFRLHVAVQELISDLYTFQANLAVERTRMHQDVAGVYSKGTDTYLEFFVRQKLKDMPDYPIDSILKWAEHIEGNTFKQAEIAAIVISALAGGLIGSLFTAVFQASHT